MTDQNASYSAVILTALQVEYQAVRAYLTDIHERVHSAGTIYEIGTFKGENGVWSVGLVQVGAGNPGAAFEAERAINFFTPNIILFVGIAGGVKDVTIGDVVVANKVYGYESGKWDDEGFLTRPDVGQASYRIVQRANAESRNDNWKKRAETSSGGKVYIGAIAAGEKVIASTENEIYRLIRSHYNDALAVEMEGRGFLGAIHANDDLPSIVIRGISDLLDNKEDSDKAGSQPLAAAHASAFAFELLSKVDLPHPSLPSSDVGTSQSPSLCDTLRPLYPRLFVGRDQNIADLKDRLGILPGTQRQTLTIIRGWPGVGKTTFINRLLHDETLKASFSNGILWAEVGPQDQNDDTGYSSSAVAEVARWAREIGILDTDKLDIEQLVQQISVRLKNKNVLLVVDDIWRASDGQLFKRVANNLPLLLTTRFRDIAEKLKDLPDDIYWLNVLNMTESLQLIELLAPMASVKYASKLPGLVESLEGLPLALRVAGSLIGYEESLSLDVSTLIDDLTNTYAVVYQDAPSDRMEKEGTTPTIRLLLKRSVDTLDEQAQEDFAILGAFAPKPATFDLDAIKYMWEVEDPVPAVKLLVGRGLLEPLVDDHRFQMHATLKMYAESMLEDD